MEDNRSRSLFWPIVLIGGGLIWLLANLNLIPGLNLRLLFRLWPLVLIVIGLNLLIGKRAPWLRTLIALGAVAVAILFLVAAPALQISTSPEVKSGRFTEPVGGADFARVQLDLSVGRTTLRSLSDSNNLIDAQLTYIGEIEFIVEGTQEKSIHLRGRDQNFNLDPFDFFDENDLAWDIGLTPDIPIDLDIDSGVGETTLNLEHLSLSALKIDSGVGELSVNLPAQADAYVAEISGGVGQLSISLPEDTDISIDIDGGVGEIRLNIPRNAAVRLDAETSVGRINLPSHFTQVSGSRGTVGESGVWETTNFDNAEYKITIEFNGGVGEFTIR